jgi:hypothetical protein
MTTQSKLRQSMAVLPSIVQARAAKYKPASAKSVSGRWGTALAALALLAASGSRTEAASCRGDPAAAARAIKPRVEALRLLEREAADRAKGLDTRPYTYLVGQARTVADAISEPRALKDEDGLDRCPDAVPHVRRVCAIAARSLAAALDEQGGASISTLIYGEAMAICEGFMRLPPLRTPLRGSD